MKEVSLAIDGVGWWSASAPRWPAAQPLLLDAADGPLPGPSVSRPTPPLLSANERRRAPDSVLLALEVASAALAGSGHAPADVASVFTSAHGDLGITDAMCRTLAGDPRLLSPTRFHHSVHNAASGYWAIASANPAPSTALAAGDASFAVGLLEAASLCTTDARPVLLVGFDTEACGALRSVNRSRGLFGAALLLSPQHSAASRGWLRLQVGPGDITPAQPASALGRSLADNAMADALPLFEALAGRETGSPLALRLSSALHLQVSLGTRAGA